MANFNLSANMNMPIPVVGQDPGPDYALNIDNCLTLLDLHDHTSGKGIQITPAGININSDFSLNGNNAISLRSLRMNAQGAVLSLATDLDCLYVVGVDLYYNDGNGNNVRITQSGGVVGSPGSISGLTSPASASYVSGSSTFVWQSDANTPANMDGASYVLRNLVANSFGLTLSPPSLSSNYGIVLPILPGALSLMTIDASGNIGTAAYPITGSQIASNTIATSNLIDQSVTAAKIQNNSITADQIRSDTRQIQKFIATSSTTFTTSSSSSVDTVYKITCVGGGGGGGQWGQGAGGGGGGATSISFSSGIAPVTLLTITVGAGGAGTSTDATNGGPGQLTEVQLPSTSRLCSALGGGGGIADGTTIAGGSGGFIAGQVGDILIAGGTGGNSYSPGNNLTQGNGGDSTMGGGGRGGCSIASRVGAPGGTYGGGGGGATAGGSGAGASGIVVIEWVL